MENKKINLLFFEPSSGFGGSGNALANLLNHIDKDRFYPVLVILNEGPQFEKIKDLGIEIKKIDSNILPLIFSLVFIIKKYRIDLVHVNTNIISGIPAIIASKVTGIPCICHIRQTRKLIKREKIFIKCVDSIIVINRHVKETMNTGVSQEKVNMIYDGIDLSDFSALEKTEDAKNEFSLGSSYVVGIVGRIIEGKGHDDFIKAAPIILKIKPKVKFLIIGIDPSKDKIMEGRLKDLSRTLNVHGSLIFTGWRTDIPEIVSCFNVSVQPYTAPEGLPNVIIEAMALNKPVVATKIPGPSEIVLDNETGFLVPAGNPEALAEAVLKLLDNPELAKRMGEAGRKRVEEFFDIKKNVKKMEEIYGKVLCRQKKGNISTG